MKPWLDDGDVQLYQGHAETVLLSLPEKSVQTCITSPPYWGLRDYGTADQIGLEATPEEYIRSLVDVFRKVRQVLRDDGTLWLNLGDSYGGPKGKELAGIPWRVAFALQADGWYLRSDIIWSKPNPMPESVTDRPTKAHEYLFLLSKQPRYFYDADAIREDSIDGEWNSRRKFAGIKHGDDPKLRYSNGRSQHPDEMQSGRNRRSVWTIPTQPFPEAHFATYPEALVRPCILAGSKPGDLVLDPFIGSGTTALAARKHVRRAVGIDLSSEYLGIAARRLQQLSLLGEGA